MNEASAEERQVIFEASDVWFVFQKHGRIPRWAHKSEEAALAEAVRLAEKCPGKKFHVLRSVAKISVREPLAAHSGESRDPDADAPGAEG